MYCICIVHLIFQAMESPCILFHAAATNLLPIYPRYSLIAYTTYHEPEVDYLHNFRISPCLKASIAFITHTCMPRSDLVIPSYSGWAFSVCYWKLSGAGVLFAWQSTGAHCAYCCFTTFSPQKMPVP